MTPTHLLVKTRVHFTRVYTNNSTKRSRYHLIWSIQNLYCERYFKVLLGGKGIKTNISPFPAHLPETNICEFCQCASKIVDDLNTVVRQLSISSCLIWQEILNFLFLLIFYRSCWYLGRVGRMDRMRPHLVQWQEVQISKLQQCSFGCCLCWRPNSDGSVL